MTSIEASPADGLFLTDLVAAELRDPEWLVRGYVPMGELTLLVGHGGVNKGTFAAQLAAAVSRGEGEKQNGEPSYVLWAAAEDAVGNVLKPRLMAAGANLALIKPFGIRRQGLEDGLCLPDDVPALRQAVESLHAKLVIVDPLLSHLSGKVDSYRDHDVKRALRPLAQMANETGCAVLGVHHLGKSVDRGALLSAQGSGAFANTARIVLAMVEHDEDERLRVLEVVKANVSRKGLRKALRVELVSVDGLTELVPRTVEDGAETKSVDELLSQRHPRGAKKSDAKQMILRELATGPKPMEDLKALGVAELGCSGDTVWRAANALKAEGKAKPKNSGPGTPWLWFLTSATNVSDQSESKTSVYITNTEVSDFGKKSEPDFLTSAARVYAEVSGPAVVNGAEV